MPTRDAIERFNRTLISLGNEPSIAAQRGEEIEDVTPSEEGLPEDLSDLLGEGGDEDYDYSAEEALLSGVEDFGEEEEPSEEPEEGPPEEPPSDEEPAEEPEEPGEEPSGEEPSGEEEPPAETDDLSFLDEEFGFEDEGEPEAEPEEAPPEVEEPAGGEEAPAEEPGGEPAAEEPAAEEPEAQEAPDAFDDVDFSQEEDPFAGIELGEDFDEVIEGGEEGEEPAGGQEPVQEAEPGAQDVEEGAEDFDFEDLEGGFELPESEEFGEPEEAAEAAEPQEPAEAGEDEGFEIDFGDEELGGGEELGEELGEGFGEEPEEEAAEEPAAEGEAEDFEIEGGDEFTFDDEEEFETPGAEGGDFEDIEGAGEDVDEFSLGDFGAEFGVLEETGEEEDESELNPALDVSGPPPSAPEGGAPDLEFSEEDFERLQKTLAKLPLNVKIAAEEVIGDEQGSPEEIEQLTRMLIEGDSARRIADHCSRFLHRDIQVPRGYERRTGVSFEQEKESFAYQFRENILPVLRVVALTGVIAALLIFLGYRFVYQPLRARGMYERGLDAIEQGEYQAGNQWFDRAVDVWRVKGRYYEYAESFIDEREYARAEEKYEQLLAAYPGDKQGILDYAALETEILGNYGKAEELLNRILAEDQTDYEALLAAGDNYMAWAEENPAKYESARVSYARLIEEYGGSDLLLFRMLLYFIRTDNLEEVLYLKNVFHGDSGADIDPYIYAELGGYLISKDRLDDVLDILRRSLEAREDIPDTHYHLARHYRRTEDPGNERRALNNAVTFFQASQPLDSRRAGRLVDTYTRRGEYYYEREEYLTAREDFQSAIDRYEGYRSRGLLQTNPEYGRAYARLGDISYYVSREYDDAFDLYANAEDNGYADPELDYKQGFVHYRREDFQDALNELYNAEEGFRRNRNLLYAIANSLYYREAYSAAQGVYLELLETLDRERDQIQTLLVDEDPEHRALIEYLIRVNNNLGVTLQRIARRQSDPDTRSESLLYLQESAEYATNLRRDDQTGIRSAEVSLAQLNLRDVLYPREEFEVQIYNRLPMDFEDLDF